LSLAHKMNKTNQEVKTANKEIQLILKKYNLVFGYNLDFPIYKILPDEVKLALKILVKHGMKIVVSLKPQEKK